jgi:hypothetical protein
MDVDGVDVAGVDLGAQVLVIGVGRSAEVDDRAGFVLTEDVEVDVAYKRLVFSRVLGAGALDSGGAADEAFEQTVYEDFVQEEINGGRGLFGLYPLTDDAVAQAFKEWRAKAGRAPRVEARLEAWTRRWRNFLLWTERKWRQRGVPMADTWSIGLRHIRIGLKRW